MKFFALTAVTAALTSVKAQQFETPIVQDMFAVRSTEDQLKDTIWYIDGLKGYYEGFHKALYKQNGSPSEKCLNDETIKNISSFQKKMIDPLAALADVSNIQEDFNMFARMAEIMENLSICRFEESPIDIMTFCTTDATKCTPQKLSENMSKNMFVLIGKMTSMAENLEGFPAKENEKFKDQMHEFGQDAGTFTRVLFNFNKE